jgi:hypothetical protein
VRLTEGLHLSDIKISMIKKIISSGKNGVCQAALEVAIDLGIQHGGWIPKGRRLADKYQLQETKGIDYSQCTELNILESDGTLILTLGKPMKESKLAQQISMKHHRPCLHLDLYEIDEPRAVQIISTWIEARKINTLNITGPKADKDPQIHEATKRILITVLSGPPLHILFQAPKTVDEAVKRLISEIPLKEKTTIANMKEKELSSLYPALSEYIRNRFGLGSGNEQLNTSCRFVAGEKYINVDDASVLIIHKLWKKLRKTHAIRTVK